MPDFKAEEPIFPARSWDARFTQGEMGEWLEWIAEQAEEFRSFPSWKKLQSNFKTNFPGEGEAPSDKTLKRLLIKRLRDSGRGEWIK